MKGPRKPNSTAPGFFTLRVSMPRRLSCLMSIFLKGNSCDASTWRSVSNNSPFASSLSRSNVPVFGYRVYRIRPRMNRRGNMAFTDGRAKPSPRQAPLRKDGSRNRKWGVRSVVGFGNRRVRATVRPLASRRFRSNIGADVTRATPAKMKAPPSSSLPVGKRSKRNSDQRIAATGLAANATAKMLMSS